jgi:hypothetical protein
VLHLAGRSANWSKRRPEIVGAVRGLASLLP